MSKKEPEERAEIQADKYGSCDEWIKAIIGASPIPQFIIDRDHRILFWNEALEKYSGIKSKNVLGTNQHWKAFYRKKKPCLSDLLLDGKEDLIPELYRGRYNKSEFIDGAYEAIDFFPHMGESGIWLDFTASTIRDSRGVIIGAIETLKDVTEQKILEEEQNRIRLWQEGVNRVLESVLAPEPLESKLKIITDGVTEIFGVDLCRIWLIEDGDLCESNCIHAKATKGPDRCDSHDRCLHLKASSGHYAYLEEELYRRVPLGAYTVGRIANGENDSFLTNDAAHEPLVQDHKTVKETGLSSFAEYRMKPPGNEILGVFAVFSRSLISPEMDRILQGLSRSLALIIQKEIAEKKVIKSRDYYLKLFDEFPNPIWRSDNSGKCDYFNKEWLRFTGRTVDQEMGGGWTEGVHPEDFDLCLEIYTRAFSKQQPFEMEYRLRYNDGTYHWLLDSGKPFYDFDGRFAGYIGACYDINDRKLAEEALKTSEEKYKAFFDTSVDCVFITTIEGRWVDFNNAAMRLFGYDDHEELMDIKISDLYADPGDRKKHIRYISEKGYSHEYPVDLRKKDGTVINTLITTIARKDDKGRISGFQGTIRDVTEKKRAEEAIQVAVKLNQMIDSMSVDESMRYTLDEAERLTESRIGFFHFVNPDEKTIHLVAWSTKTSNKCYIPKEPEREYPITKAGVWVDCLRQRKAIIHNDYAGLSHKKGLPKGHVGVTREIVAPIFDKGRIVAIIGVGNKSTDYNENDLNILTLLAKNAWTLVRRKQAEEELRESHKLYRELVENIDDVIFSLDLQGNFMYISPVVESLYGYSQEDMTGRHFTNYIHPDDQSACIEAFKKRLKGEYGRNEFRIVAKNGKIHYVMVSQRPILDDDDKLSGFNYIMTNITRRKQAEEEEQLTRERFETLLKVSEMHDASEAELSEYVMQAASRMTDSSLAFIGTMKPDESVMDIMAWSESTMKECKVAASPIHYPIDSAGIWADAVRKRVPKIANNYSKPLSGKKGLPKGHVKITRFLSVPVVDDGRVVMVAAVANKPQDYDKADVTRLTLLMQGVWVNLQRRRAEEALRESEYRFRELFNSMSSGVAVYRAIDDGADFEFIDFNHGAEIIEKIKKKKVIGRRVSEVFPGVTEFGLMDVFRRVWQNGKSEHHPVSLYTDERISSWRENYVYRLPSMEIVAIYEDVTGRKQAEEALRENENRYRTLFEESPISLWEEDFSKVKDWIDTKKSEGVTDFGSYLGEHQDECRRCARMVRVIQINHATTALFGADSSEEFSRGVDMPFSAESLDSFCDEIVALSKGETEFEKEVILRTFQGEDKIVIMKVIVVPGYEQSLSRIFVSVIDITQRKNVEESLREANKKLNMLSSITRHDILNMIMVIRGYLELSDDLDDKTVMQGYLEKEKEAVNTIQRQIEFTRYYQDIGVKEPDWQDTEAVADSVAGTLDLNGIKFENSLKGLEIFCDPLIEKVFYNLIENSLRHGEHVTSIGFSYSEEDDGLVISYRDNGTGISEEDKEKLFKKGFGKHTGLGLFLSKEILSITGITIAEDGVPGKGVDFRITVPKGSYRYNGNSC
ncbi:PAS domain S-box protein [Methanolacinia paynteri]|uniref:PAS domain S-box protein n=1 Tax=Methanolacinia paynteri TaxID=230356 RepID=UPI0006942760|nr:PAS domain S-box protein [Methanolacinia paynteri]